MRSWVHKEGLSYQLSYAWDELETIARLTPGVRDAEAYRRELRALTAQSNERLFRLVEESSIAFERGDQSLLQPASVHDFCERMQTRLLDMRNDFVAGNLDPLAATINADCSSGPVLTPQIH